jgi:hypothetical protein
MSPLLANVLCCTGCGEFMRPEVIRNMRGNVEHLLYKHHNAERGCSYQIEAKIPSSLEMRGIRPDGEVSKL